MPHRLNASDPDFADAFARFLGARRDVEENADRAAAEILARALPGWDEPTLGTVLGAGDGASRFVYIGRSQWRRFDPAGATGPEAEMLEPWVMAIELR